MPPHRNPQWDVRDVVIEELQAEICQLWERFERIECRGVAHRRNQRDIPEFDGRMDAEDFCDWLLTVKRMLECRKILPEKIVKIVAAKLIKNASLWWENLKRMRYLEGKAKVESWIKMKKMLRRKYLPDHYRQKLFLKFHQLKQEQLTVDGYGQRAATSRRGEVYTIESEGSEENHFAHLLNEDEEVDNTRNISSSLDEQKDNEVVRDVFGDSDEDERDEYGGQNDLEQDSHRSPMEEEGIYGKDLKPEDIVPDEDAQSEYEDENLEQGTKEKPIGPPLEINIPLSAPPDRPDQMNIIRVSNIMSIEPKPFDPITYVEEDVFEADESEMKKRIHLEDNNALDEEQEGEESDAEIEGEDVGEADVEVAVGRYWSRKSSSNDKFSSSCNYKNKFFPDKCRVGCGKLVWIWLRKESFPHGSISKLKPLSPGENDAGAWAIWKFGNS